MSPVSFLKTAFRRVINVTKIVWLMTLLWAVLLCAAVWIWGDAISFAGETPLASTPARAVFSLVVALIWATGNAIYYYFSRSPADTEKAPDARQLAMQRLNAAKRELTERINTFFARCKHLSKEGRIKRLGYDLPWYLVLGPSGSGKSTFIRNSGLRFPLAAEFSLDPLSTPTETESVEFWIDNEAVLVDVPGLYFDHERRNDIPSENPESMNIADMSPALWQHFLSLLRQRQGRHPINGVILVLSLDELLDKTPTERTTLADTICQRLHELSHTLHLHFPVYLVLNKSDMLAGFMDFFSNLSPKQRQEILGVTLSLENRTTQQAVVPYGHGVQPPILSEFTTKYGRMVQNLFDRLLEQLQSERDAGKRAMAASFPERLAGLHNKVYELLETAFMGDRYRDRPILRGVYFTSAQQRGIPFDPLMEDLARAFELKTPALASYGSQPVTLFTETLLPDLVFRESGLAVETDTLANRRAWGYRLAFVGLWVGVGLMIWLWNASYERNTAHLNEIAAKTETFSTLSRQNMANPAPESMIEAVEALHQAVNVYPPPDQKAPYMTRLGLYQGNDARETMMGVYTQALAGLIYPRFARQAEEAMRTPTDNPEKLQNALRVYLMYGMPERIDQPTMVSWMDNEWRQRYPGRQALRSQLGSYLSHTLENSPPALPLDQGLIAQVRAQLLKLPPPDRVYMALKTEGLANDRTAIDLPRIIGAPYSVVFEPTSKDPQHNIVPGMFTRPGLIGYFEPKNAAFAQKNIADAWIFGQRGTTLSDEDLEQFQQAVRERYARDYIDNWLRAVVGNRVVPFKDIRHGAQVLAAASGPTSPIIRIFDQLKENTSLSTPRNPTDDKKAAKDEKDPQAAVAALTAEDKALSALSLPYAANISQFFLTVNTLSDTPSGGQSHLTNAIKALGDLNGYMQGIANASDIEAAAYNAAKARIQGATGSDPISEVRRLASMSPAPLNGWLNDLADQSWRVIVEAAYRKLNERWKAEVYTPFRNVIGVSYPFGDGSNGATIQDYSRLLGNNGALEQFVNGELSAFVDTQKWQTRQLDGSALPISPSSLSMISRTMRSKGAILSDVGSAKLEFSLRPATMDPTIGRTTLEWGGERLEYFHGPARTMNVSWQGNAGGQVRLTLVDINDPTRTESIMMDGPWAWFRLMDKATITSLGGGKHRATFNINGRKIAYDMWFPGRDNPFAAQSVQLPSSL